MKKTIFILLIIALVFSAVGCTGEGHLSTSSKNPIQPASTALQEEPATSGNFQPQETNPAHALQEIPKYGGSGSYSLTVLDADTAEILEQEDFTQAAYPVYIDLYPTDQGGPTYEITDSIIAQEKAILQEFLSLFFGEGEYEVSHDTDVSHMSYYEDSSIFASASCKGVSISSAEYPFPEDLTAETLHDNPLISTALAFSGIKNPTIQKSIKYNREGLISRYQYTIFESNENPFVTAYNRSFSYIEVVFAVSTGNVYVQTSVISPAKTDETISLATNEQIKAFLTAQFPDAVPEDYIVEIYYDSHVQLGYYIPCYRVYLEEPELSTQLEIPVYTVLSLTNTELLEDTATE